MEYSIFRFTLNMHTHRSQATVSAFCGDTAIQLRITLADGSNVYKIDDGCVAVLSGTKADGYKLLNRCVIENNTIIYDFTEQTTGSAGIVKCEITLYDADDKVITSPKFTIVVDEREVSDNDVNLSQAEYTVIADIMKAEAVEKKREANEKKREANEAKREANEANRQSSYEQAKKIASDAKADAEAVGEALKGTNERVTTSEGAIENLEERVTESEAEIDNLHSYMDRTVRPTDEQRTEFLKATDKNKAVGMKGWYRIAETTKSGYWSSIFHVQVQVLRSASTSDAMFTAERMSYQSDPSIGLLSFASQRGEYDAIDNFRVVYLKNKSNEKAYLEVHINRNASPDDAWDGTGTSTGYKFTSETHFKGENNWSLIEPILVSSEVEDGWTVYEKSPFTSAWSQVTASVDDINEFFKDGVPNIDNSTTKTDELKALVDLIHPTMRVDLGEAAGLSSEDLSEKKAVQIALNNALSYECSYVTYESWGVNGLPSDFGSVIKYNITFVPESRGFIQGPGWDMLVRGNVTNVTADLGKYADSYKITDIQASRAIMGFYVIDGMLVIDFDTFISITIRNPAGKEITYEPDMWTSRSLFDTPDIFFARVLVNEETSIFKTSTYDMRTQSIDRQLLARLEEEKARREAAKASEEET